MRFRSVPPMLRFAALAILWAVGAAVAAPTARPDSGFTFIQMADPQFGMWSGNKDTVREEESFRKAVDHINRLRPAFVVISGDLINTAFDPEQTRVFWREARRIRPDIPLRLLPGNHDIWGADMAKGIATYTANFGPDRYAFSHGGSRFIVLNSNLVAGAESHPRLEREQRWWFRSQLEAARAARVRHVFVLTHHPWFLERPDEPDQYFNIPRARRTAYLDLMREYGVTMALAGHLHREAFGTDGALRMITTGPVGQPLGNDPSGFRIVRVTPDRVEEKYYGLEEVPSS